MASIQASIEIYDKVSQPMNAIITSLYASVNALVQGQDFEISDTGKITFK